MSGELISALESMDVLNRWVRKTGVNRPRKAVYWIKSRYAIRDAIMAGLTTKVRLVGATVKCNRCRNGTYITWDGAPRGQCYHCNGKGTASLKFVETTIADRFTWHTPLAYNTWLGWPMNDLAPVPVEGWEPGREGIDLPLDEAAKHLNVVEVFWPQWTTEKPHEYGWDEYDNTAYFTFNYSLDLPPFGEDACFLCGRPRKLFCAFTFAPGLTTRWPTCETCSGDPSVWKEIKGMPLPRLPAELEMWRDRHALHFAEFWKSRGWASEEYQLNRIRA